MPRVPRREPIRRRPPTEPPKPPVTRAPLSRVPLYDGGPSVEDIYTGARRAGESVGEAIAGVDRTIYGWIEDYKKPQPTEAEKQAQYEPVRRALNLPAPTLESGAEFWKKTLQLGNGETVGRSVEALGKGGEAVIKGLGHIKRYLVGGK